MTGYNGTQKFGDNLAGDAAPVYAFANAFQGDFHWSGSGNPLVGAEYIGNHRYTIASFTTAAVPEPEVYATVAGLMLVGFGLYRRQVSK